MVDTINQYKNIQAEVDAAVLEVVRSGRYINGPWVHAFRENLGKFLGAESVIACANGTDALQVALMALNLEPGAEVITSPFTFFATAEVIALLGLRPVFVDIDPDTYNIDPGKIEAAITDKTGCIIPVHLFGQPADMEPIMEIAKKHELYVIEDNAQAIGADYTMSDGETIKPDKSATSVAFPFTPAKTWVHSAMQVSSPAIPLRWVRSARSSATTVARFATTTNASE